MKRFFAALFPLCLLLSLAACGAGPQDVPPATPGQSAAPPEEAPPTVSALSEESSPTEESAWRAAFAEVLRTAHDRQVLPDGTELDNGGSVESIEGNLFALHDVDGDGEKELILLWQNAIMAGQVEAVYGYDAGTGQPRQELRDFPGILFYDNGTAEGPWSHNQGWGNTFWPYNLHQYRPETGVYEDMGSVDAWDRALVSDGFPQDVDTDGDGMIYFLLTDNWNLTAHRGPVAGQKYWYYEQPPVDGAEYLAWRDSIVGDAEVLELSFVPLTAENIAKTLDVPYVELLTDLHPNALG